MLVKIIQTENILHRQKVSMPHHDTISKLQYDYHMG